MSILKTLTINGTTYSVTPVVPASSVTLYESEWVQNGDVYSQVVEVPGVTPTTKVDLQPTSEQLAEFHYKVLAFVAENAGGVVTVYSIGDKPEDDHTIQITKTEVAGAAVIRGNTVGTTMPRPDWNQTDPNAADYIRNKPDISGGGGGATGGPLNMNDNPITNVHYVEFANGGSDEAFNIMADGAVQDEDGNMIAMRAGFYESSNDMPVVLGNIAPGVYETDAVTLGQFNETAGSISTALDHILSIQNIIIGGEG